MKIFLLLMAVDFIAYYAAWFYAWSRLGRVAMQERSALRVPSPWIDFSYKLFAFTASRCFLRIGDRAARQAFGFTLALTLASPFLLLAFWLTLPE